MAEATDANIDLRASSPPPWASPSLALSACPQLDRSVSTASSVSSVSGRSTSSRLSDGGTPGRRRGYIRPQATVFADSARNRESVMSLGTISHLQYYFARTGLLDGKGAQLARSRKSSGNGAPGSSPRSPGDADYSFSSVLSEKDVVQPADTHLSLAESNLDGAMIESPIEQDESGLNWDEREPLMLPPTVSTYNHRVAYVPPPPDVEVLRRELREALEDARKVIDEVEKSIPEGDGKTSNIIPTAATADGSENQGWYEIQGLHLLDIVTLAIRAAKNFYTAHADPQRLYAIRSERRLRGDLYQVLDVLKRMATRNFAGGVQLAECGSIASWIKGLGELLDAEEEKEKAEQEARERWAWRTGDWTGKERERELAFIKSFDSDSQALDSWPDPHDGALPTPFLQAMQNGLRLVLLHNNLLRHSKRQFEEIKAYHTDTAKPYRCAENLRFWIKAAQRRWEVNLDVPVMDVVYSTNEAAWLKFDQAILAWCKAVREELTSEWEERKRVLQVQTPTLRIAEDLGRAFAREGSEDVYDA